MPDKKRLLAKCRESSSSSLFESTEKSKNLFAGDYDPVKPMLLSEFIESRVVDFDFFFELHGVSEGSQILSKSAMILLSGL